MDNTERLHVPASCTGNTRRPLLGVTMLLVEDSRFCSEAVRLMCAASGARLRRADSLRAAHRHLATYRPSVALVDLGLPDGSGLEIIAELAACKPNAPVILATSGEDRNLVAKAAMAAGADGFISKPLHSLAVFQAAVLDVLPNHNGAGVWLARTQTEDAVAPDPETLKEDLDHALSLVQDAVSVEDLGTLAYCAQFLSSLGDAANDRELVDAASGLSGRLSQGEHAAEAASGVVGLVTQRMKALETA